MPIISDYIIGPVIVSGLLSVVMAYSHLQSDWIAAKWRSIMYAPVDYSMMTRDFIYIYNVDV